MPKFSLKFLLGNYVQEIIIN